MYILVKVNNKNCNFRYNIYEVKQNMDANEFFELVKNHYKDELNLDLDLLGIFQIKQEALNMLHDLDPDYQAPINHRDNNGVYHSKKNKHKHKSYCSYSSKVRVPSLKRSKRTWKKFYELFPNLKDEESLNITTYYRGRGRGGFGYANKKYKLKKIKSA